MLKLAVLSDIHLGFGYGTERAEDAYGNFEQAIKLALKEEPQPQLILLCGDIFHDKIPRQEILGKAIEVFTKVNKSIKTRPQLLKRVKDGKEEVVKEFIPPIIGIWGTHERRHPGSTNPVQILEKAGLLYCLHAESILVECGYDRIGLHGLSGVPESYARDALKAWNPKAFTEGHNILLIHQNIKEVMPPVDFALEFADFPKEFVTFAGHIHNTSIHEHPISKKPIVVVGSTVSTQLQKVEAETQKGFYIVELGRERYEMKFVPIRTRPFFYETVDIKYKKPAEVLFEIDQKIGKTLKENAFVEGEKPIIRVKLEGTLADGFRPEDLNFGKVLADFGSKVILSLDKSKLTAADTVQSSKLLADIREKKLSVDEIGIEILSKNIGLNIDVEKLGTVFNLLAEGELEQAERTIEGRFEPKSTLLVRPEPITQPEIQTESEPVQVTEPVAVPLAATQPKAEEEKPPEIAKPQTLAQSETVVSAAPRSEAAPEKPRPTVPDPEQVRYAESGLSMLAKSDKSKSKPAATLAPKPAAKEVLTQGGKVPASSAESGLSMLARSDKKPAPAPAKPAAPAPTPAQLLKKKKGDDDIIVAKKSTFDLKKFLNKEY